MGLTIWGRDRYEIRNKDLERIAYRGGFMAPNRFAVSNGDSL